MRAFAALGKRTLTLLMTAMLLLFYAFASAEVYQDYEYELDDAGKVRILRYLGTDTQVSVPWQINRRMVSTIGPKAFADLPRLRAVKLPASVTTIEAGAFSGCTGLETVELPTQLKYLEDDAFAGCELLQTLTIPDTLVSWGENCLPAGVVLTGTPTSPARICARDLGLEYVMTRKNAAPTDEKDPEEDYNYVIQNGEAVITGYIGSAMDVIVPETLGGYPVGSIAFAAFSSCYDMAYLELPETLHTLEKSAIRYCRDLTEVKLPSSLRVIGESAFYQCNSLETIVIPEGVTSIERYAFKECERLRDVTLPSTITYIQVDAFYGTSSRLCITAPAGSYAATFAGRRGIRLVTTSD